MCVILICINEHIIPIRYVKLYDFYYIIKYILENQLSNKTKKIKL